MSDIFIDIINIVILCKATNVFRSFSIIVHFTAYCYSIDIQVA